MGIFDLFRKKQQPQAPVPVPTTNRSVDGVELVKKLEDIGFFKYTDPTALPKFKLEIANQLSDQYYCPDVDHYDSPSDLRHYFLDGEDLFEEGGILSSLKEMKPLFEKMNIQMEISDHFEQYDVINSCLDHHITINGKKYIIFEKFEGYGWGEAAQRFADIINDQLQLQGTDERFYLILSGNDGRAVFLTDQQFDLLNSIIESRYEKPLKIHEWCELNQVTYYQVC